MADTTSTGRGSLEDLLKSLDQRRSDKEHRQKLVATYLDHYKTRYAYEAAIYILLPITVLSLFVSLFVRPRFPEVFTKVDNGEYGLEIVCFGVFVLGAFIHYVISHMIPVQKELDHALAEFDRQRELDDILADLGEMRQKKAKGSGT